MGASMSSGGLRIVVSAALSRPPFAPGSAWNRIHYLVGLRDLGHEVYFVEELSEGSCVDKRGNDAPLENSINARLFVANLKAIGFEENSCLLAAGGRDTVGLSFDRLLDIASGADLLINFSGHLSSEPVLERFDHRLYLDQDPVYTQLWQSQYGCDLNFDLHDTFATVGMNIGTEHSSIPDCGVPWVRTLPPVVLSCWPHRSGPKGRAFTTVATWSHFGDLSYRGEWYGSKREEFLRISDLPDRTGADFEIVVRHLREEDPAMKDLLEAKGWTLRDGRSMHDVHDYRDLVAGSIAEIGVAKHAYIKGNSGWFSERSAQYLASGRPVLASSTGFERVLPTGQGLISFSSLEEAADGVASILDDHDGHGAAARDIAETFMDHRKVLPKLLESVGQLVA